MVDLKQLQQYALRLLAKREYSCHQLRYKLRQRTTNKELIEQLIQDLCERDWLSDHRFTINYINNKQRQGHGPQSIKFQLQQQGITSELLTQYLDPEDETWIQQAKKLLHKKSSQLKTRTDQEKQVKIQRFLYNRGFTTEQITRALNQIEKESIHDP